LYQYDITEQELQMLKEGVQLNLTNKISILSIENTNIVTDLNAKEYPCFVQVTTFVAGTTCTGDGHHSYGDPICRKKGWDAATPGHYITESVLSSCSDGSGGFDNGDDGPYDPTETTGGGGTHTTITTPTFEPCETCEEFDENSPCEKIKNKTNSAAYKQKFKALTGNYNLPNETGFSLVGNNYVNGTAVGSTSISVSTNSKNMTHVHNNKPKFYENTTIPYDGAIKILSTADITDVLIPMQSNNTSPTDTFVTMLSDEGIYSISILEPITWNDDLAIKFEIFDAEYRKFSQYIVDNYTTMSVDDRKDYLEKKLLLVLKEIGLENKIGLFEGEVENVNSSDINNYNIKWTRKKLKKVFLGHQVDSEPCV
jgi:hypothetical protein